MPPLSCRSRACSRSSGRCARGDICRTTASGQAYLQQELRARKLDEQVRLLTISFDPARDPPAALAAYARKMKADPELWTFATVDDPADLRRLLKLFEIVVLPEGLGGFVHNGAIFLACCWR